MSYCNFCNGGLDNIATTFGGSWTGAGPKFDVNSWKGNPNLVPSSVSNDARRVSQNMWKILAGKGQCITTDPAPVPIATDAPTFPPSKPPVTPKPIPPPPTPKPVLPTAAPTLKPSPPPTFLPPSPKPSYGLVATVPTFSPPPKDGRIWYRPGAHCKESNNCETSPGVTFDMVLLEEPLSGGILVGALQFEHIRYNATVDVYTIEGSSASGDQQPWKKVASVTVDPRTNFTKVEFDSPFRISPGGKRGFYLINRDMANFFLVGRQPDPKVSPSYDINGVGIQGGSVRFGTFGVKVPGYNPTVQAGYLIDGMLGIATPGMAEFFTFGPELCVMEGSGNCFRAPGYMFNVRNTDSSTNEIDITRISFQHMSPTQQMTADLYRTINSSYAGNEQNAAKWVKIATVAVPKVSGREYTNEFVLDQPITLAIGETIAFYIETDENILVVRQKRDEPTPTAENVQLLYGSAILNGAFGIPVSGYSWNGAVTFTATTLGGNK
jgi:hypothetical protein